MTDLLRGGNPLSPGNPSYCAAATRTLDVSRSALDAAKSIVLNVARNSLAVVLSRPLGAAVMITSLSISTFCAVGYVHYKRSASDERFAAHRAERANVNLQDALGRLRDELAATKPRIDTPDDSGTGQTPASERDNTDRVAQFITRTGRARLSTMAALGCGLCRCLDPPSQDAPGTPRGGASELGDHRRFGSRRDVKLSVELAFGRICTG